MEGE
jgi:hypothetical protein